MKPFYFYLDDLVGRDMAWLINLGVVKPDLPANENVIICWETENHQLATIVADSRQQFLNLNAIKMLEADDAVLKIRGIFS